MNNNYVSQIISKKLVKITFLFAFMVLGYLSGTKAQKFNILEYNLKIRIEADSVLLIRKYQSFKISVFITSQNKVCLNKNILDSEHYYSSAICYELQGFHNGGFVSYRDFEGPYGADVSYTFINGFFTELSTDFTYDCSPFQYHQPISNRIYRFRVFFRLNEKIINKSEWKYVYVVRRKSQIKELQNWSKLMARNSIKTQILDSFNIDSCLKRAELYLKQKEFEKSREYSLKAIEMDSLCGEAYFLIACAYAGFTNSLEDKHFPRGMINCLAVDKFQKALEFDYNDTERLEYLIEAYSRHFPSKEGIHDYPKIGSKYKVGYWINEETTVRYSNY